MEAGTEVEGAEMMTWADSVRKCGRVGVVVSCKIPVAVVFLVIPPCAPCGDASTGIG